MADCRVKTEINPVQEAAEGAVPVAGVGGIRATGRGTAAAAPLVVQNGGGIMGFHGLIQSFSPASVLDCNSQMAFSDHNIHQQQQQQPPHVGSAIQKLREQLHDDNDNDNNSNDDCNNVKLLPVAMIPPLDPAQPPVPAGDQKRDSPTADDDDCDLKSHCKRRKTVQTKKVIHVPIGACDGRQKSDGPPSDMWAWRKYGQKPIKGSPYPRGYYRCSSSKGCGARKQVERSCADPSMLIITYTSEHNHPWPVNRHNNSSSKSSLAAVPSSVSASSDSVLAGSGGASGSVQLLPPPKEEPPQQQSSSSSSQNIHTESAPQPPTQQLCSSSSENLYSLLLSSSSSPLETMVSDLGFAAEERSGQDHGLCSHNYGNNSAATTAEEIGSSVLGRENDLGKQEDDFYADLGELPESAYVFSRGSSFFYDTEDSKSHCVPMDRSCILSWPPGG